jgi:hypothetical protein
MLEHAGMLFAHLDVASTCGTFLESLKRPGGESRDTRLERLASHLTMLRHLRMYALENLASWTPYMVMGITVNGHACIHATRKTETKYVKHRL